MEVRINSKIYVPFTKNRIGILMILVYCSLAIYSLLCSVRFFLEGFDTRLFITLILYICIAINLRNKTGNKEHFEFCYAHIYVSDKIISIKYMQVDRHDGKGARDEIILCDLLKINKLEYSDILNCLKITGEIEYSDTVGYKTKLNEHLLYIENNNADKFLSDVEDTISKKIIYMDR